jgi:hypothetical protein
MGLTRIFVGAVAGTLIPTAILAYVLMSPSSGDPTQIKACEAAENFVRQSVGADKPMSFLPCDESKEKLISGTTWQVMGDVEIGTAEGEKSHEAYLVRLDLGDGSTPHLETMSLR